MRVRLLKVQDDDNWACFAVLVKGQQFALPVLPGPALSGYYISLLPPARLYGELQVLSLTDDAIEVESIPICSYRVIARSKLNSERVATVEDWQMFRSWIRSVPGMDSRTARHIGDAVRQLIEQVGPGWVRSPSMSGLVAERVEEICRRFGGIRHSQLYRWTRLFLA